MTSSLPDYQRQLDTKLSDNAAEADKSVTLSANRIKAGLCDFLSANP